jgi:fused signal recognition particle receptor
VEPFAIVLVVVGLIALVAGVVVVATRRGPSTDTTAVEAPLELKRKLARTRGAVAGRLAGIFGSGGLGDSDWSALEETLIGADLGVATASAVTEEAKSRHPQDGAAARRAVEEALTAILGDADRSIRLEGDPAVVLVVGVNGTGKTTSIAKLAARLNNEGHRVLLAAADTFRAAAAEQLTEWARRVDADVVSGVTGGDPAAIGFEAYQRARREGYDVVIVDTAGRLHSKTNLMDELGKVARVLEREAGEIGEVLLVLDGTTGQNAIAQAQTFTDTVGVTGIVMTKLDGTARGGIAVAVERDLGIPVKLIGVGEGVDDLLPFEPDAFVDALLEP